MMNHKKTIQTAILGLVLANLFLGFQPQIAFAQSASATPTQKYKGVQDQIRDFLCTPSDASKDPTASRGDLYNCINKIYRFALVIVSIFAVFMIVIGAYVYMSAEGNEEAVSKAKDILVTSIASIIILSSGYILLRFLNPDLIKFQSIQPESVVGKDKAYSFARLTEEQIKTFFSQNNINVETGKQVAGMAVSVTNELANLKRDCSNCNITVTSSTGGSHAPGECSHASGNKVDLRMDAGLTNYIEKTFTSIQDRNDSLGKVKQWRNSSSGAVYAKEDFKSTSDWTGPHWDIAVCGGGTTSTTVPPAQTGLQFLKPWAGTDPYPDGDYSNTKPELRPAVQAFSSAWQQQGGSALQVAQAFRSAPYQDHLRSVWETYRIENNQDHTIGYGCSGYQHLDATTVKSALAGLTSAQKATLQQEYNKHKVTGPTPPACKSDHSEGIAVDITPPTTSVTTYTRWMQVGEGVGLCHYISGDTPHFALKQYLPSGTNCLIP